MPLTEDFRPITYIEIPFGSVSMYRRNNLRDQKCIYGHDYLIKNNVNLSFK